MKLLGFLYRRRIFLLIATVLMLASALRLYRLDRIPPSPYWEETALGYDAYSIALTGKDHHGNPYPLLAFPSFGDYKPSGYFYAIVPFIKLLGLTIWSVRLPSVLAGVMSVLMLYLIGKELLSERVGLISAFLLAIQPWAIHFSRGGWEVNLAMCFVLLGSWALLKSRRIPWFLPVSVLFFCLSMYTYHAARLFAPIMGGVGGMLLLFVWERDRKPTKRSIGLSSVQVTSLVVALLLVACLLFPFVTNLKNKEVSSRFTDTSIFSQMRPILDSNAQIIAHGNTLTARILYHRYWYFGRIILTQWASHFSPSFLFVRGDGNYRHGGWTGLLSPVEGVLIFVSLCMFLYSLRRKSEIQIPLMLTILWLVTSALAPALVTPAPHALRFLFASPAFALLSAFGIVTLVDYLPSPLFRKFFVLVLCSIYLFSFARFYSLYLVQYPVLASSDWQYGYEQLFAWIAEQKRQGEQVYITREQGRPSMYYLFYERFDPNQLQKMEAGLAKDQLELLQVGDYHFIDALSDDQHGIIATSATKIVVGGKIIHTILDKSDQIVWVIWRK